MSGLGWDLNSALVGLAKALAVRGPSEMTATEARSVVVTLTGDNGTTDGRALVAAALAANPNILIVPDPAPEVGVTYR